MNIEKFDQTFLGPQNVEGFNYPISEEKVNLLMVSKDNYIQYNNKINLYIIFNLILVISLCLFVIHFNLNKSYLMWQMILLSIPAFILFTKKINRWHLVWIDFLLSRNQELLSSDNVKELKWKNMIF